MDVPERPNMKAPGGFNIPLGPFFSVFSYLPFFINTNEIAKTKKEETIMATKKSMWVLLGILLISAWVHGSVTQAGAAALKGRSVVTVTKDEKIPVNDEPGHALGMQILEGLTLFENGEIAKTRGHAIVDSKLGKGAQAIAYGIYTFDDGSTIVSRTQRLMVPDQSGNFTAQSTSELIKGTGRFEGIKGTSSGTGKNFLPREGEALRVFTDFTWTYTLPTK